MEPGTAVVAPEGLGRLLTKFLDCENRLSSVFHEASDAIFDRWAGRPLQSFVVMEAAVSVPVEGFANDGAEEVWVAVHVKVRAGSVENRPHLRTGSTARSTRIRIDRLGLTSGRVNGVKLYVSCPADDG